jgi:hypothetical protein
MLRTHCLCRGASSARGGTARRDGREARQLSSCTCARRSCYIRRSKHTYVSTWAPNMSKRATQPYKQDCINTTACIHHARRAPLQRRAPVLNAPGLQLLVGDSGEEAPPLSQVREAAVRQHGRHRAQDVAPRPPVLGCYAQVLTPTKQETRGLRPFGGRVPFQCPHPRHRRNQQQHGRRLRDAAQPCPASPAQGPKRRAGSPSASRPGC